VCGFLQSLGAPLTHMGMSPSQRARARLNLVPCLSLLMNPVGLAVGIWILVLTLAGDHPVDPPLVVLSSVNIVAAAWVMGHNWHRAWILSRLVLADRRARLLYVVRVNPLFVLGYWLFWTISLVIGIQMFIRDKGLVWERTEKVDANHDLVRELEASVGAARIGDGTDTRGMGQLV
jgi:glycosyltransferase XagB